MAGQKARIGAMALSTFGMSILAGCAGPGELKPVEKVEVCLGGKCGPAMAAADRAPWGNGDRKLTPGELHAYVRDQVERASAEKGQPQPPQIQGDAQRILSNW